MLHLFTKYYSLLFLLSTEKGILIMKIKNLLTGIFAACVMTLLLAGTAMASTFGGHLDSGHGNYINGWAWDSSTPDAPVTVQITVQNTSDNSVFFEQSVTADQYREDLEIVLKQSGNHAFSAYIDWTNAGTGEYRIQASTNGTALSSILYYKEGAYRNSPFPVTVNIDGRSLIALGNFKTTAYCPCHSCSEGWGRSTSTGAVAAANHTIAVDPRVLPYGSQVMINGIIYTAKDRGGGVKGNHIDIFFDTHGETRQYGVRNVEVYLVS